MFSLRETYNFPIEILWVFGTALMCLCYVLFRVKLQFPYWDFMGFWSTFNML